MSGYASNNAPTSTSGAGGLPVYQRKTTRHGVRLASTIKYVKPTVKARDYVYTSKKAFHRPDSKKLGHLPGYSGTVPHLDLVQGRSFGKATRHAFASSPIDLFVEDSIPPAPQATDAIKEKPSIYTSHGGRMPGYTGYMPHSAHIFGCTFGGTTVASHSYHNDNQLKQRQTMNRVSLRLASAPTPKKPSKFF